MFESTLTTLPFIKAAKLRALAVSSATRSPALPEVPIVAESVPGYEATAWFGIGAPKNAPTEIVERLNKEINTGLADPEVQKRIEDLGGIPMPMSRAEFAKLISDETEKWAKVIKFAGIKVE
jgi:tripartite-type tricarboxylate transporter receptor subunit TctC